MGGISYPMSNPVRSGAGGQAGFQSPERRPIPMRRDPPLQPYRSPPAPMFGQSPAFAAMKAALRRASPWIQLGMAAWDFYQEGLERAYMGTPRNTGFRNLCTWGPGGSDWSTNYIVQCGFPFAITAPVQKIAGARDYCVYKPDGSSYRSMELWTRLDGYTGPAVPFGSMWQAPEVDWLERVKRMYDAFSVPISQPHVPDQVPYANIPARQPNPWRSPHEQTEWGPAPEQSPMEVPQLLPVPVTYPPLWTQPVAEPVPDPFPEILPPVRPTRDPARDPVTRPRPDVPRFPEFTPGADIPPLYEPGPGEHLPGMTIEVGPGSDQSPLGRFPTINKAVAPRYKEPFSKGKEVKKALTRELFRVAGKTWSIANVITESRDLIRDIWKGIDYKTRAKENAKWMVANKLWRKNNPIQSIGTPKPPYPSELNMIKQIYNHATDGKLDWDKAITNVVENQVQDYLIGRFMQKGGEAARAQKRPIGYGAGVMY